MPFIDKINQLEAAKAKVAELEKNVTTERQQALAALPSDFGYADLNSFIKALKAASKGGSRKGKKAAKAGKPAKVKAGKRKRAKITPEVKQQVIAAVQAGTAGAKIAKDFGISLPSVQNIKKEAGLVKARAASAPAAS
ncbi:MAG: helix-turn-helix domain-containing protein [Verrucomicrobia bacterium]|nr:helix-turn-helix domain-containing protein [Verrucomicrobiota bacterium]